jgi:hypothetical protein
MDILEYLNEDTTSCPECAETIELKAKKCRFCGSEFDPLKVAEEVEARKAVLSDQAAIKREGKAQCPKCGNWNVCWSITEDGSMGHWCGDCNQSLKAMGFDKPGKPPISISWVEN